METKSRSSGGMGNLFNRFAHSAGLGISVWRLGGMGSVRSGVSRRIGLLGWIGLFGWIGVFGWLAWLIWLFCFLFFLIVWSHFCFIYFCISVLFFDEIEVWRLDFRRFGVTFLMKLRSGGLLFREMGSMGDLRSLWGPNTIAVACS